MSYTSFRRCHTTEAENHHANPVIWPWARGSGSLLSTNPPFMDICFTSCATGQALPSSAARPWLIFRVSERRVAVLPHRNPTNRWPLDLESSQSHYQSDSSWAAAAFICRRRSAPVFAQALKSLLELRDTGCLLRLNGLHCPPPHLPPRTPICCSV